MGILKSIFGPSTDEIWAEIATEIGGEFIDGGFWKKDVLVYKYGEWHILLDTYTVTSSTGQVTTSQTYTRMRVPFINSDGISFRISRASIFTPIGKFLGMQYIKVGEPLFDKQFVIKGNKPEKIRLLFADNRIRELCHMQPGIHIKIKDSEGWFGTKFPENVDELYFECALVIKKPELLKALFGLFCMLLERLVQIESASPGDPGVVLK